MIKDDIKNLVVLDTIKESLELLDSDIMPQSESHPLVSGIENVPSQLISTNYRQWTNTFTTFPLSPLEGRVHFIKDSFLHFKFNINFQIVLSTAITQDIYMYVGPRDTASIFNQLTLMMDNNTIWNTSYHQIESAISLAALPASVIDHSPDYATIDKLLHNKDTPMKLIRLTSGSSGTLEYSLTYDLSIDLNRLCIPFSNLEYITSNMGNLRLKVYINNIADSFYYFVVPPSINKVLTTATASQIQQHTNASGLLCLNPIMWGTSTTNITNYVDIPIAREYNMLIGTAADNSSIYQNEPSTIRVAFIGSPGASSTYFITFDVADINQTCFDLEEDGWNKLCEYFGSMGKVILPAQQFTTTNFNNGSNNITELTTSVATLNTGSLFPNPLIGFAGGNNITDIIITYPMSNHQTCLLNPFIVQSQCLLDGKPINATPYDKISGRAIKDFTNACIDTDHEEINTDYLYSLQFPPFIQVSSGDAEPSDSYFYGTYDTGAIGANTFTGFNYLINHLKSNNGYCDNYIKNPNLYMLVFETGIPDSFHTGACISEFSNRQAMIRLTGTYPTQQNTFNYCSTGQQPYNSSTLNTYGYQWYPTIGNVNANAYLSVLCDICIVLDYDNNFNTCTAGYVSYAKPYLTE